MEEFRNEMNAIHAPKDLIRQTKQLMHEENEKLKLEPQPEEPVIEKKTPWFRNVLIFAAGAGLAYAGYLLTIGNNTNRTVWQSLDTGTDPYYGRAGERKVITQEEFVQTAGMDLAPYTNREEYVSAEYWSDGTVSEADLLCRYNEEEYHLILTPEEPQLPYEAASEYKGRKVLFQYDKQIGFRRALWQIKDGWIRLEGFGTETDFMTFLDRLTASDQ